MYLSTFSASSLIILTRCSTLTKSTSGRLVMLLTIVSRLEIGSTLSLKSAVRMSQIRLLQKDICQLWQICSHQINPVNILFLNCDVHVFYVLVLHMLLHSEESVGDGVSKKGENRLLDVHCTCRIQAEYALRHYPSVR